MTKTLLAIKGVPHSDIHGSTGVKSENRKASLSNLKTKIYSGGILPALARLLCQDSEDLSGILNGKDKYLSFTIKSLLYNLPFIHRSYCLTYKSAKEAFYPIDDIEFVRKNQKSESWIKFKLKRPYNNGHTVNKISNIFESYEDEKNGQETRAKNRFNWSTSQSKKEDNVKKLINYHKKIRKELVFISGPQRLWYVKRDKGAGILDMHSLVIIFAVSHRLSELSRYNPTLLNKYFDSQENWLLSEFINTSLFQFLDCVASEITGHEFMPPNMRSRAS
jgi:hypothetical protein